MVDDEPIFPDLPLELRQSSRWVVWKYGEARSDGKRPKQPCDPASGEPHDKLDPDIWRSLPEATRLVSTDGRFDGVGLVVSTPFLGVDIDHVRDPKSGETDQWALDLIQELNSYTELSPSGTGYHVWLHGKVPRNPDNPAKAWNRRAGRVETYSEWWFTITGQHAPSTPTEVRRLNDQEVSGLFQRVPTCDPKVRTSQPTASATPQLRAKTKELLALDPEKTPDQSAEVHKLLIALLVDTTLDTDATEVLFKTSALYTGAHSHWGSHSTENKWSRLRQDELRRALPRARAILDNMLRQVRKKTEEVNPELWPEMFHTYAEFTDAKELSWAIEHIAQEQEITIVGGLAKHGKTWLLLSIAKALLTGEPLFGIFPVKTSKRVVYLIPEVGMMPFKKRLVLMRLMEFVRTERLYVRTLSKGQIVSLTDPRILKAAEGADVFLDTAVRFIDGDEKSASDIKNSLSRNCLGLLEHGARSLFAAHHSPKAFGVSDQMTLENVLRGSGDIGAMLSNAYGLRQLDPETNLVHVECLCGRDLDKTVEPFQIEGRPHINNTGNFKLVLAPGEAGNLSEHLPKETRGRKPTPDKDQKVEFALSMKKKGHTIEQITKAVNEHFPRAHPHGPATISAWLRNAEPQMELGEKDEF